MATLLPGSVALLPQHLSASERDPNAKPNFTLALAHPILARLERCSSMRELRQLHAHMITTGLARDPFAASRLLAFCALSLHGDLRYALALFRQTPTPNLFSWNAIIRAFARSNRPELSLRFYVDMLQSGLVLPDSYTFPFLLKSCTHLSAFSEGQQIHAHAIKFGLWGDPFVSNSLIHMYAEIGCLELAMLVFERMPEAERSEVSWAAMIAGFADNDRPEEAVALFRSKDWRNIDADQVTLAIVLSACLKLRDLQLGKDIHGYIQEKGLELSLILSNSLMNMYAKCGQIDVARLLFYGMPEKDLISWNIMISGCAENGHLEEGLQLLSKMKERNIRANEATFLSIVSACERLELALEIHGRIREMGLDLNVAICNALIDMYSRIGNVDLGRRVFDEMPERDIISWNSMIAGYARCGSMTVAHSLFEQMPMKDNFSWSTVILGYVRNNQPEEAIRVYKDLLMEGRIKPDKITMLGVLTACSHLGALEEGKAAHLYLKINQVQVDTTLGTALVDMYSKCGCLVHAVEVFEGMQERDVFAWTAMISGLATHGRGKEAVQVFKQMQTIGGNFVKPNSITFLSVLSACVHAGLIDEGQRIYYSMPDYEVEPEMVHIGCMVDLFGRAGLLKEAADFIVSLGYEADANVWGALLGACRIHGNVELGKIAYEKILELDPLHDGAHVLMSNLYAESGQWNEAKGIRRKMKDRNISKEVAKSWIEVDGAQHLFTAGDIL
ncbi:pentatricopeptide repeat-containing protein At3g22690-like [Phoenix dactylifera]|uniref:Pentatricopeptide repeat-containing protein At3g22690-like n=1 Tax=Phoenix dactylifera TaxID=42345 RepID=A0A8B7C5C8_PHODC|nr:pentatricopeptide repeat-containing protein At3g22690-like [Phoenix dactylifera]